MVYEGVAMMRKKMKRFLTVLGAIAASSLVASIMIAPAFADDPTSSTKHITGSAPHTETEVVPYDASVATASTEVLVDTDFNYLDYSPEIDVTYTWEETLEWVYVKSGKFGFWFKGANLDDALANLKDIAGERNIEADKFEDVDDETLSWAQEHFKRFGNTQRTCRLITFVNNAIKKVKLGLEAPSQTLAATTIEGRSYPSASIASGYLNFRTMIPYSQSANTTVLDPAQGSVTEVSIGTDVSSMSMGLPGNKRIVGINPKADFQPANYKPWVAENRGGNVIQGQIKIILTKDED